MRIFKRSIFIAMAAVSLAIFGWKTINTYGFTSKFASKEYARQENLEKKILALEAKQLPPLPDHAMLDVPLIKQMDAPRLYNGCEVTSLTMVLNYHGYKVSKNELAKKINRVPLNMPPNLKGNPNEGFVGNMEDGPGLGVFHGPIVELAKKYAGDRVVDLTNQPFSKILNKVAHGNPVWIITTTRFAPVSLFQKWNTPQGTIEITFSQHSVVITGYDKDYIYINDPYGFKNRKLNRDNFIKAWEQMGKQAVSL